MEPVQYEVIVQDAIGALPEQIRSQLENVVILISDTPPARRRGLLLGLYEGVPVTHWGRGDINGKLPDTITLYRPSIERVAKSEEEIPHIVRETLWHEIAHHFGFDHDTMHDMEKRWRERRNASGNRDDRP